MKSILWVEDDNEYYNAFSYEVEEKFRVTRAIDYVSAVNSIETQQFDLIIVDIILPSGNHDVSIEQLPIYISRVFGIELIDFIRNKSISTPIIALTVVSEKEKIDKIKSIDSSIMVICKYDSTGSSFFDSVIDVMENRCQIKTDGNKV